MDENITVRCYTEYKREIYSLSEMVGENKRDEENILGPNWWSMRKTACCLIRGMLQIWLCNCGV